MSNCAFQDSFKVCSQAMRALRLNNPNPWSARVLTEAWNEAQIEFGLRFSSPVVEPVPAPKPPVAQPSVPFELREPVPLPSYHPCFHGTYDDRVCSLCRGMGVSKPFEAGTDEDEPQAPEVAELTIVEEQAPVAGQDDESDPEIEPTMAQASDEEADQTSDEDGDMEELYAQYED